MSAAPLAPVPLDRTAPRPERTAVTLGALSAYVGLPVEYLESLGCREEIYAAASGARLRAVAVPYFDREGRELRTKLRMRLKGEPKYIHDAREGVEIPLYGLDQLSIAAGQRLWVVEGESDCWALWYHGINALGVNGASRAGALVASAVGDAREVVVWREPGQAGRDFAATAADTLTRTGFRGTVWIVTAPAGVKDPCALHRLHPGDEAYVRALDALFDLAFPVLEFEELAEAMRRAMAATYPETAPYLWPNGRPE